MFAARYRLMNATGCNRLMVGDNFRNVYRVSSSSTNTRLRHSGRPAITAPVSLGGGSPDDGGRAALRVLGVVR